MGYLGNTPGENFITFSKQVFTIVNSQTAYTLNFSVVDENEIRLVINNVVQEPGTGKAYTASGTTLTLASALTNGTDEMYCVFLGKARETVTVPTITKDKLNLISNATAGLTVKGDGGSNDGYIALNCSQNSHAVKIKAPPHSAGQSYTLTLPQSITNNTFLKTDGSGNLSFAAAGGTMTPAFEAYLSGNQTGVSDNTNTKVQFNTEIYDTANAYDNSSNYRFTPQTAGKYFVYSSVRGQAANNNQLRTAALMIRKNNSEVGEAFTLFWDNGIRSHTLTKATVVDMNGSSDYLEVYAYVDASDNQIDGFIGGSGQVTNFGAYKIIE